MTMLRINDYSLYLVISEEYAPGKPVKDIAREAITGGVDLIQMREKNKAKKDLLRLGIRLCNLCRMSKKLFIVNDDPFLAKEIDADGLHVGQEDIKKFPLTKIRDILGSGKIIGVSTHSFRQFKEANASRVDYIAFGPVFPTRTKDYFIGTSDIEKVLETATKPVFFIGGINLLNIDELLNLGVKNIALIRGILEAEDIGKAAIQFKEKLTEIKGKII